MARNDFYYDNRLREAIAKSKLPDVSPAMSRLAVDLAHLLMPKAKERKLVGVRKIKGTDLTVVHEAAAPRVHRLSEGERHERREKNRARRDRRSQRLSGGSRGSSQWMARAHEAHRGS